MQGFARIGLRPKGGEALRARRTVPDIHLGRPRAQRTDKETGGSARRGPLDLWADVPCATRVPTYRTRWGQHRPAHPGPRDAADRELDYKNDLSTDRRITARIAAVTGITRGTEALGPVGAASGRRGREAPRVEGRQTPTTAPARERLRPGTRPEQDPAKAHLTGFAGAR